MAAVGVLLWAPLSMSLPVRAVTRNEVGISTSSSLLRMNDKDLTDRLNTFNSLGITWIRMDFSWATIQANGPKSYDWRMYDRIVDEANAHHLKILAVLDYTPSWAREPRCAALVKNATLAQKCNPRSADEFGHFAGMVAMRYKGSSIRGWEIWNEPNLTGYWKTAGSDGTLSVDPVVYARMANAAAAHIRAHYPDSVILTGGLAAMFEPTRSTGMRQGDYLSQLLPHLNARLFDGVAIHPYSWPALPSKEAIYNAFYTVDDGPSNYDLQKIMAKAGWGHKELWATEFGASTKGVSKVVVPTRQSRPDHVSEALQSQIVQQGIADWYQKDNVGPMFVHSDSDQWLAKTKNEGGFGLQRSDGTKKPAYYAFKKEVQLLSAGAKPQN